VSNSGGGYWDFRGLIERLAYIQSLDVTCLWLLPCHPSRFKDDGYDIDAGARPLAPRAGLARV
jgi:glycosidase